MTFVIQIRAGPHHRGSRSRWPVSICARPRRRLKAALRSSKQNAGAIEFSAAAQAAAASAAIRPSRSRPSARIVGTIGGIAAAQQRRDYYERYDDGPYLRRAMSMRAGLYYQRRAASITVGMYHHAPRPAITAACAIGPAVTRPARAIAGPMSRPAAAAAIAWRSSGCWRSHDAMMACAHGRRRGRTAAAHM